jgi:hypothetical protein
VLFLEARQRSPLRHGDYAERHRETIEHVTVRAVGLLALSFYNRKKINSTSESKWLFGAEKRISLSLWA